MASEIAELLKALTDGTMSLRDVAQRFRERTWPPANPPAPESYMEMAERALQDPRPDIPNTFDEVVAAYGRGELTRTQYRVLAEAVAEAKRARQPGG